LILEDNDELGILFVWLVVEDEELFRLLVTVEELIVLDCFVEDNKEENNVFVIDDDDWTEEVFELREVCSDWDNVVGASDCVVVGVTVVVDGFVVVVVVVAVVGDVVVAIIVDVVVEVVVVNIVGPLQSMLSKRLIVDHAANPPRYEPAPTWHSNSIKIQFFRITNFFSELVWCQNYHIVVSSHCSHHDHYTSITLLIYLFFHWSTSLKKNS